MFAARQCESVSTELHGKRRGVSRCGVSVLPCGHKHVARDKNMSDADLRVCCFWDMMRRSNPRIVRTTFNHSVACVCFRSATRFRKAVRTSILLCCSLTADVCVCLEPVEAAPPSLAISFCVEKQWSARLFSTAVFSSCPPAQQWTSVSVKNCTTRGVALHSSVCTLPFFGAGATIG